MEKNITSHWSQPLQCHFTDNSSHTLCIILPGIKYFLDRSYLDYGAKLASSFNMDILKIEYGFQLTKSSFDIDSEFDFLAEETLPAIMSYIKKPYKKCIMIGKSIGTCLQVLLNQSLTDYPGKIMNIFLSPINKTVSMGIPDNSLVFTGLSDPWMDEISLKKIRQLRGIHLITIEGANHSLDIPEDILKTIDVLKENFVIIENFICS